MATARRFLPTRRACLTGAAALLACGARSPAPPRADITPTGGSPDLSPELLALLAVGFERFERTSDPRFSRRLAELDRGALPSRLHRPFLVVDDASLLIRHRPLLERAPPIEILWITQPLRDLEPLRGLTNVRRLWLETTARDFSPLYACAGLVQLYLMRGSELPDPAALTPLTALQTLAVAAHPGVETEPLTLDWAAALPELRELHLMSAPLSLARYRWIDLDGLRRAPRLTHMTLWDYAIPDLGPLAELPRLEAVELLGGRLDAAAGLARIASPGLWLRLAATEVSAAAREHLAHADPRVTVTWTP